ncbi:MAG: hypothetical protein AAGK32_03440, partial [Actinomycetota bacterium]
ALVLAGVLVVRLVDADDEEPANGPPPTGGAGDFNPTGYDGAGAESALTEASLSSNGDRVILGFEPSVPASVDRERSAEPLEGGCGEAAPDPVGEFFVSLRLDGGVDLSALGDLGPSGSIITVRSTVGQVRSLTVMCHGADETVIAIGLAEESLVTVDEIEGRAIVVDLFPA